MARANNPMTNSNENVGPGCRADRGGESPRSTLIHGPVARARSACSRSTGTPFAGTTYTASKEPGRMKTRCATGIAKMASRPSLNRSRSGTVSPPADGVRPRSVRIAPCGPSWRASRAERMGGSVSLAWATPSGRQPNGRRMASARQSTPNTAINVCSPRLSTGGG